jgi:hypothetical protein
MVPAEDSQIPRELGPARSCNSAEPQLYDLSPLICVNFFAQGAAAQIYFWVEEVANLRLATETALYFNL